MFRETATRIGGFTQTVVTLFLGMTKFEVTISTAALRFLACCNILQAPECLLAMCIEYPLRFAVVFQHISPKEVIYVSLISRA